MGKCLWDTVGFLFVGLFTVKVACLMLSDVWTIRCCPTIVQEGEKKPAEGPARVVGFYRLCILFSFDFSYLFDIYATSSSFS